MGSVITVVLILAGALWVHYHTYTQMKRHRRWDDEGMYRCIRCGTDFKLQEGCNCPKESEHD